MYPMNRYISTVMSVLVFNINIPPPILRFTWCQFFYLFFVLWMGVLLIHLRSLPSSKVKFGICLVFILWSNAQVFFYSPICSSPRHNIWQGSVKIVELCLGLHSSLEFLHPIIKWHAVMVQSQTCSFVSEKL